MVKNNKDIMRVNGVYYTPNQVAEAFIRLSGFSGNTSKKTVKVFDPAFGNGSLLRTANDVYKEVGICVRQVGCDIDPDYSFYPRRKDLKRLSKENFFTLSEKSKFDVIFANPPYVKSAVIEDATKQLIREQFPEREIHGKSDLWVYFLLKSLKHLERGANVGMILPWSILQADYAVHVREILYANFNRIRLLALNDSYFNDAQERVVFLYLYGYGSQCKQVELSYSMSYKNEVCYTAISKEAWLSNKVTIVKPKAYQFLYGKLVTDYGFTSIEEIADVKIGVVTGANNFFIRDSNDWDSYSFELCTRPIITKSAELLHADNVSQLKRLLLTDISRRNEIIELLNEGVKDGVHLRSHSRRREVWHSIEEGPFPDAFFPYRVKEIPFLLSNNLGVTCTNSVHRVFFKSKLSAREKKWLLIASLSIYTQVSFLINAKTYGRGMVKMEPTALKKSMLPPMLKAPIAQDYHKVVRLIKTGNKFEALLHATNVVTRELNISNEIENKAFALYRIYAESNKR